jgi:hypothetical protein
MDLNCVKVLEDNISPSRSYFEAANICMSWWATLQWRTVLSVLYTAQRRLSGLRNIQNLQNVSFSSGVNNSARIWIRRSLSYFCLCLKYAENRANTSSCIERGVLVWFCANCLNILLFFLTFTWPCIVTYLLIIKPTRCTDFSNLFWNETLHVSDNSSVHHQELFTVHSTMVYVIQVCRELSSSSRIRMEHPYGCN